MPLAHCISVHTIITLPTHSCYLFCKKLLEQYGEDIHYTESILQALAAKVGDLKERLQNSS